MSNVAGADALSRVDLETGRPLWRSVLDALLARRQRHADRLIGQSFSHPGSWMDNDFRIELERRLMGQ